MAQWEEYRRVFMGLDKIETSGPLLRKGDAACLNELGLHQFLFTISFSNG